MPKEIFDEERFLRIAEQRAIHCRVKRKKDTVKLKLRTKKYLYTLKTDPSTAEQLLNQVPCDVIELR